MDGRLARNPPKGQLGDAIHAVMCGAGHNLRLIFRADYSFAFIPTVNAMPMRHDGFIRLLHKWHGGATCCVHLRYACIDAHALFILRNRPNAGDELEFFSGLPACNRITRRLGQGRLGRLRLELGAFVPNRTFTVLSRHRFRGGISLAFNFFGSFLLLDDDSSITRVARRIRVHDIPAFIGAFVNLRKCPQRNGDHIQEGKNKTRWRTIHPQPSLASSTRYKDTRRNRP